MEKEWEIVKTHRIKDDFDHRTALRQRLNGKRRVWEALGDLFSSEGADQHLEEIQQLEDQLGVPKEERYGAKSL